MTDPVVIPATQLQTVTHHTGPSLATQYTMVDLIASATNTRAGSAYWSDTGRTYGADVLRRRLSPAGQVALIEGAGTRLGPPGGDITASPEIGASSVLTDLGGGVYRALLPDGSGTFFWLYNAAAITGDHTLCFEWRKTPGSTETGTLTVQAQDASSSGPKYLDAASPPDEWTEVCVTQSEPGTSVRLAFYDTGGTDFQIRRCQFESHPYPTSWIPDTTRAADDPRASVITQPSGFLVATFRRPYDVAEVFNICEATGGINDLSIVVNADRTVTALIEGAAVATSAAITATETSVVGYAWDNGTARLFLNSAKVAEAAASDPTGSTALYLYRSAAGAPLNGIGTMRILDGDALSDDQCLSVMADELARIPA